MPANRMPDGRRKFVRGGRDGSGRAGAAGQCTSHNPPLPRNIYTHTYMHTYYVCIPSQPLCRMGEPAGAFDVCTWQNSLRQQPIYCEFNTTFYRPKREGDRGGGKTQRREHPEQQNSSINIALGRFRARGRHSPRDISPPARLSANILVKFLCVTAQKC